MKHKKDIIFLNNEFDQFGGKEASQNIIILNDIYLFFYLGYKYYSCYSVNRKFNKMIRKF